MARIKKQAPKQDGNKTTTVWSWERLVRDVSFNKGYKDFKAGFWDYAAYDRASVHFQTQYERGRLYAAAGGPTIKNGRTTNSNAIYFYKQMWAKRELV